MKVKVFGIGYVGLVQGAVLADAGHDVFCIDVDGLVRYFDYKPSNSLENGMNNFVEWFINFR